MSGLGVDTRTIVLSLTLPNGSKVVIRGEHDGVNPGMTWDADCDDVTIPVEVMEDVQVDGIHSAREEAEEAAKDRSTCSHCLARTYRGNEDCVCEGDQGDAEDYDVVMHELTGGLS